MTKLPLIIDDLIRSVESIHTDSAKFPARYLQDLCDQFRAQAIKTIFERTERIHPAWLLSYIPDFDPALQDDILTVKFWVPAPISMGTYQNGISYSGTKDGRRNFKRLLSQSEYATYSAHRSFNNKEEMVLIGGVEGDLLLAKVYNNKQLKEIRFDGVWSNPTSLSTYNYDKDMYPLCDEGITMMKQLIVKSQLLMQEQIPADLKQDEKPAVAIPGK